MMAEDNEQRERTIQKHTRLNLREEQALRLRMAMAGNPRFNSFSIQSLLASQIIHIDFTDTKQLIEQMARIGNNLNQLAHVANESESLTQEQMNVVKSEVYDLFLAVNDLLLHHLDVVHRYEQVVLNGNHENTRN
ncbi:MAG: MobC family plasmid mobilization relaxosome protein [Lacticaseibacillus paracasei]|nr:MobC family plasmid mobilization relaxosome protein [Lacticaseibacillus paracasei]MDN6697413.1 MobC family plasmid mobilization relaxosome protein [Lacticaseibacillus paracasei]MDN6807672.1 MobC family plasmid mobilization relaxosome protein [Lacticaseibacillus paracasei]